MIMLTIPSEDNEIMGRGISLSKSYTAVEENMMNLNEHIAENAFKDMPIEKLYLWQVQVV